MGRRGKVRAAIAKEKHLSLVLASTYKVAVHVYSHHGLIKLFKCMFAYNAPHDGQGIPRESPSKSPALCKGRRSVEAMQMRPTIHLRVILNKVT